MLRALSALMLALAVGCGALPAAPSDPGELRLRLHAAPDVRVLALDVLPAADGWTLVARLALPQPVLAAERTALLEGLDADGTALFAQPVDLRLRPVPPRYAGPRPASLRAALPSAAGLARLRLTLAPDG